MAMTMYWVFVRSLLTEETRGLLTVESCFWNELIGRWHSIAVCVYSLPFSFLGWGNVDDSPTSDFTIQTVEIYFCTQQVYYVCNEDNSLLSYYHNQHHVLLHLVPNFSSLTKRNFILFLGWKVRCWPQCRQECKIVTVNFFILTCLFGLAF